MPRTTSRDDSHSAEIELTFQTAVKLSCPEGGRALTALCLQATAPAAGGGSQRSGEGGVSRGQTVIRDRSLEARISAPSEW